MITDVVMEWKDDECDGIDLTIRQSSIFRQKYSNTME